MMSDSQSTARELAASLPSADSTLDPTEQALRDANQRLQSILFAPEVATWTWNIAQDRVVADPNMARLFGIKPEDAAGAPIETYLQAIHPEDRPRVFQAIHETLEGQSEKYEADYRLISHNGTISWVTARGRVERDARGNPAFFPGVVIDITARKMSEQKAEKLHALLEERSHLFDLTLSSIKDFAYILDREARFVYVNQALLDLWGLTLPDALGKNFFDLKYPDELAAQLEREVRQVFESKTGLTGETPYTSPAGVGGYYEYIFRPVFDRDGNVDVVAGSTRDITERKRTEEALRQSQEKYRALAETLESLVHDRTIQLEARNQEVLVHSEQLRELSVQLMRTQDEERRHIARELHDSAGQIIAALSINLGRLITRLRDGDPAALKIAEETRSYVDELNQEIRTTSYLLHPPLLDEIGLRAALNWYVDGLKERAGIAVSLDIREDFARPSLEIELTVFRAIQECLTNIHRPSGSKSAFISVYREGSSVVVKVRDEGQGISAENLKQIRGRGAGVGLRGLRERVRQFAGQVSIESKLGGGTTLVITLPERSSN